MKYDPKTNSFNETQYNSLGYLRGFLGYYGWITETGTPPDDHLDIMLLTELNYKIGDLVWSRLIGVFYRNDLDHKYLGVEIHSAVDTFEALSTGDIQMLNNQYPVQRGREGWYGIETATAMYNEFMNKKRKTDVKI